MKTFTTLTAAVLLSSITMSALSAPAIKKATIALPDLSIANHMQQKSPAPNTDKFKVYVKNTGQAKSAPSKMSIDGSSGGGEVSVPAINPGSGTWVEVTFFEFKDNSTVKLYIDSQKKVMESNEKNNAYRFNWKPDMTTKPSGPLKPAR